MTWTVDFTRRARSDLVGLEDDVVNEVLDALVVWTANGPPRESERTVADVVFYEEVVADRYLLGYIIDDRRQRFAVLWLRKRPGRP